MFYIYCIQNIINNKIYIDKAANPLKRFKEHQSIANGAKPREFSVIHAAIKKHGIENFTFQIIEEWEKENEAYDAEEFWISFFCSDVIKHGKEAGYNIGPGGLGASSGNFNPMYGKFHTEEAKLAMSQKRTGNLNPRFGKEVSENTRKMISESRKKICW